MPLAPEQVEASMQRAREFWNQGRVGVVDLICQTLIAEGAATPQVMLMLAKVANRLGEYAAARRYLDQSKTAFPAETVEAIAELDQLEANRQVTTQSAVPQQRFHLIKGWGFGFTSDLDHTLGHLLLAEMTGRIPVIHWGRNSLFRDADVDNAWDQFFEPVSTFNITDLGRADYSFYPGKWNAGNLRREEFNKWEGTDSKTAGVTFLNQPAVVTVADFFTSPLELIPWLMARDPLSQPGGMTTDQVLQVYGYLIQKYVRPKPRITAAVEQFATEHFTNRNVQATHVRGSDKVREAHNVSELLQILFQTVQADLAADPSLFIFLLTDDARILEKYHSHFPGRIITTDCLRTSTKEGIHNSKTTSRTISRTQLGFDVLRDAYLAARCNRFLGMGTTNVSCFILHMKPWQDDKIRIVGSLLQHSRNQLII